MKTELRDKFATAAMAGLLAGADDRGDFGEKPQEKADYIAKTAYAIADAMLNEKSKQKVSTP